MCRDFRPSSLMGCGDNVHVLQANFVVRAGLIAATGAVAFTAGWPGQAGLAV